MSEKPKEVKMNINLEAMMEDRKGKFANFFTAMTSERVMILDCFFIDRTSGTDEEITREGVLSSRIIMDSISAIQLRDMLNNHIAQNGWAVDDA